jgi:hypothetical protein
VACNILLNNDLRKASPYLHELVKIGIKKIRFGSISSVGRAINQTDLPFNFSYFSDLVADLRTYGDITIHYPGKVREITTSEYLRGYIRIENDGLIWAEQKGPCIYDLENVTQFFNERIISHCKVFVGE